MKGDRLLKARRFKSILAITLLLFAGVTFGVQIGKEFCVAQQLSFSDGLNVICTHATVRCLPCLTMEKHASETLKEHFADDLASGRINFHVVDYEQPATASLADEYGVATAGILILYIKGGVATKSKNLVRECWDSWNDEVGFKTMLKNNIDGILNDTIEDGT